MNRSQTEGVYENQTVDPKVTEIKMNSSQNTAGEAAASNMGSKVRSERVILMVVSALLAAAAIVIYRLSFAVFQSDKNLQMLKDENEAMKKNLQMLMDENEVMKKNLSEKLSQLQTCFTMKAIILQPSEIILNGSCFKCEPGWEQHGGSCYYFSNNSLNWTQSRAECKRLGSDLVQISSSDEQMFLMLRMKEKMNDNEDKFWIGLTDSKEEGKWLWVDDSPLNNISLPFWSKTEPDNWTKNGEYPDGEDCARMGERGGAPDLKCWFDKTCSAAQRGLCEKPAEAAQYRLKCY